MLWTVYQNCQNLFYNTSSHSFHLNKFFNVQYWPKDGNMCGRHSQFFGLIIPISTRYQKSRKAGMSGCREGTLYSFVEQNLKSRRMQRLLVKNFTLSDRLGRQKSASRVDRWLIFALESNVEELNLDFERFASIC